MLRARARELSAAVAFLTMMAVPIRAQQQRAAEEPATDMHWAVKIPMRDGAKLNATVFALHRRFVYGPCAVLCKAWLCVRARGCARTRQFGRGIRAVCE